MLADSKTEIWKNLSINDLKDEKWVVVSGYNHKYQISNLGRVKSLKRNIIRKQIKNNGYLQTMLTHKGGVRKLVSIHRLVAEYFISKEDISRTEVNHINEIKTDNRFNNLKWCTRKENMNYKGLQNRKANKLKKAIIQYKEGRMVKLWGSQNEIYDVLGFHNSAISRCCNGVNNIAYGYGWKYL